MVVLVKTAVEIADTLLAEVKRVAHREKTTVRALIEEGLRRAVAERRRRSRFRLRKPSVKGEGLQPDIEGASWDRIRDLSYGEPGE
jgi:hypothetical protein